MAKLDPIDIAVKNGKRIQIRHISPSDVESFLEFRKQVPHDSTNTMQYVGMKFPTIEEATKKLSEQEADRIILNIGAFDGAKVVGYLNFRMPSLDHPWVQHLGQFGMMVLKEYWGLGIGKKILELQESHAQRLGM